MPPSFDAVSQFGATAGDISGTHTPVGTPRGVAALVVQDANTSDLLGASNAITYGGVSVPRIDSWTETTGEVARVYGHYLGVGVPSGAQAVVVDQSASANLAAWFVTLTASADTQVAAFNHMNGDVANPSVTIPTLTGFDGIVLAALFSGVSSLGSVTPGSGYSALGAGVDFGVTVAAAMRGAKSGADVVANWTVALDDACVVAMAIEEGVTVAPDFSRPVILGQAVQRASSW